MEGGENWVLSNTGHFLNHVDNGTTYTTTLKNKNTLSELYQTARISPSSLTYYGFCLENGDYTVLLHFAEIMFTDDDTYNSLGRRIFNVDIQGKQVLKDFNIANKAGVRKNITTEFHTQVSNKSLEIRFYWAGKGTTAMPYASIYGPLISAISITRADSTSDNISPGTIVGIVVATIVLAILLVLLWRVYIGKRNSLAKELKDLNLQTSVYTFRQIKVATNNFDISNKIGEGGFGPVYKGILSNDTIIAVKMLSSKSKQGNQYAMHGYLTDKADVYSFGIVALEIVSGKNNIVHKPRQETLHLLDWARLLKDKGNLIELVDPRLGSDFNKYEVMMMIKVALLCTNVTSNLRPTMSSVLSMLEGKIVIPEFISDPHEIMDEIKLEKMRQHYFQVEEDERSETQAKSHKLAIEGPWTTSSSSTSDLYPVHIDSSYWEKRN
ncbi:hypothetical protein VNO78_13478 [Psophocarpus tetragonolobus]|uniref:non-specific serine/threonine protein kinase n=1 Tax=Psophocarpus tetragonolobus TaxID=3891 RepID=A0AAN9XPK4_PSOTE